MLNRSTPISETTLRGLHPRSIEDAGKIRQLLERARRNFSVFHRGLNTQVDLETAQLAQIGNVNLIFEAYNFERNPQSQIFLNFCLDGRPYFFASTRVAPLENGRLVVRIPRIVFYSERRDRLRRVPNSRAGDPSRVAIELAQGETAECIVADVSPNGLGLLVLQEAIAKLNSLLTLRILDGVEAGAKIRAQLRNSVSTPERSGWMRIGVARTNAEMVDPIDVEYWTDIVLEGSEVTESEREGACFDSVEPRVLRFLNSKGEEIVGLVDSWGDPRGATVVVIPNGWGQTKEALLPLARTIVATFRASDELTCPH